MTQPSDIINGALLDIGARAAGENPDPNDSAEALTLLNAMIDQWSNEKMMIFCVQEVIHETTPNQYIYTIGANGSVGASFTGSISANVLTVTALASGALSVGQIISGTGITPGTAITSYGTATGGNGTGAIGTYYLNLSQSPAVASETITSYAPRPLRINSAIVRVVNSLSGTLDYPVAVLSVEDYELIGIKTLPGPWPRALYYQPSMPLGVLNYWPNPSQQVEMHLFCDTVLNRFATINDTVTLPQGFEMALRNNLSMYLMPGYGKVNPSQIEMIRGAAIAGKALIKRTNMQPVQMSRFDDLITAKKGRDAGWILHGGFY